MEPTRTTPENIRLTPAALDALRAEKNRTRVSFAQLLKDAPDIPRGLDAAVIGRWLKGECRSARAAHLGWVMERYRQLPYAASAKALPPRSHRREPIDDDLRLLARRLYDLGEPPPFEIALPGLGRAGLYGIASGRTRSIDPARRRMIEKAAARLGLDADTPPILPDLALGEWPETPPDRLPLKRKPKLRAGAAYVEITQARYRKLHEEIRRTRVSPRRLLASAPSPPKGLTPTMIGYWLNGTLRSAEKQLFDYVLKAYRTLPDATDR